MTIKNRNNTSQIKNTSSVIEARIVISLSDTFEVLSISDEVDVLLGFDSTSFLTGQVSLPALIHNDDADIAEILFSAKATQVSGIFNIRIRHADDRIRCIKCHYVRTVNANVVTLELLLQDAKSLWQSQSEQSAEQPMMAYFKSMMENSDDYIYFKDRNHVFTAASQSLVKVTKFQQHWTEFLGLTDYDVFLEEYADIYYNLEKQVFTDASVAHEIQEIINRDGSKGWISNRKYPIKNETGEVIGLFGIARDITESKLAEFALREREEQLNFVLEGSNLGFWDWDIKSGRVQRNHIWAEMLGYTLDEISSTTQQWSDFVHPDDVDDAWKSIQNHLDGHTSIHEHSYRMRTKSGDYKWILDSAKIVQRDLNGHPVRMAGTHTDITKNKQVEVELKESEFRWKFAIEGSGDGVWDWNTLTSETKYSKRWKEMLGYTDDDILPTSEEWIKRIHPDDRLYVEATLQDHLDGKTKSYATQFRLRCKDGSYKDILGRGMVVLRGDDGKALRMIGTHTDISELVQLTSNLRQRESYQRALLDNFPFAVWMKDTESRFLSVNLGFSKVFGAKDVDGLVGKSDYDIAPTDLAESYRTDDRTVLESGLPKNVEEEIFTEGVRKWFETYKAPVVDLNGKCIGTVGFARDISHRKTIENDLQIAAIAFESQEGMLVTNAKKVILRVNKAFTRITGYSAEEVIGLTPKILSSGRHNEAFFSEVWNLVNSTGSYEGEIWNKRKNGQIYPQHFTITAVKNNEGVVTNFVGTLTDITDFKEQERQRLVAEAENRDTLVREVHHRIKNSLQGVAGLLRKTRGLYPALAIPITAAIGQVHSIAVIHGLHGRDIKSNIQLCALIQEIATNVESLWETTVLVDSPENMPSYLIIENEAVPLALILNELISNAVKHGDKEAGIHIVLRTQPNPHNLLISISNSGRLSSDFMPSEVPIAGTGMKLVASLLPKKGAKLSYCQSGVDVVVMLELSEPVIMLDKRR